MNFSLTLGLLLLPAVALADPLALERELNELRVEVEVSELETDSGAGIESGLVQVMITNNERFKVACQLHPGETEAAHPAWIARPSPSSLPRGVVRLR
ncbi:hypothetical protein [Stutzerimonas xanthomarina]|uniref:Uncharacterized protein n=2 Tax=Stutzerimonas xanthomarina TaxID=271420 RepID=A0A1M5MB59_9GAMM|nr:hypothetical protein [Stutzerimonas xanthomarina]MCP9338906.1 hypothetical protein [Stutzerimonas xanthomarina]SEH91132.1 hypothetical protein SAMN05216535_2621 [Stutzerimonas xanthomarina]SHG74461.1 hypothetical protein SAMN02744645_1196 [Stutzerimonas xanthomarina DSM 18231]